jgi:hypothetical protein
MKAVFNYTCNLSDFHNIVGAATKLHLTKQQPQVIHYRSFKHFKESEFIQDLSYIPLTICDVFEDIGI